MGMVLPEGVLNTSNLQRVRDYFEGHAKIIFICSIPQDVFVAAGATVKPSLVFFKRFTEEEERKYDDCEKQAYEKCFEKYKYEVNRLKAELQALNADGKSRTKRAKEIQKRIDDIQHIVERDSRPLLKEYFDYEIPIANVKDAGITSTGSASSGNQFPTLEKEYVAYRREKTLWNESQRAVSYGIKSHGAIVRVVDGKEEILNGDN